MDEIVDALVGYVNDATVAHTFATAGSKQFVEYLHSLPVEPENPDPIVWIGRGDIGPDEPRFHAQFRKSEALTMIAPGGAVARQLGNQWVVHVYTGWETHFRPRLASAHNVEVDAVKSPMFGDLRRLRHDIIHHGGVATQRWSGSCEVFGHWATVGETISISDREIREFVIHLQHRPIGEIQDSDSPG